MEMICRICIVHIQPRKHVLDHEGYAAPTRQHELNHTDHTDHTDQELMCELDHTDEELMCELDHTDEELMCELDHTDQELMCELMCELA